MLANVQKDGEPITLLMKLNVKKKCFSSDFKWCLQFLSILIIKTTCLLKTPRQYKPGAR